MTTFFKTIFLTAILTLTSSWAQSHIVGMDDIHEAHRQRAMVQRLAILDPEFREALKAKALGEGELAPAKAKFQGEGHRLGGREGVNVLLGVGEVEADVVKVHTKKKSGLKSFLKTRLVKHGHSQDGEGEGSIAQQVEGAKARHVTQTVASTTVTKKVAGGELKATMILGS